MTPPAFAAAFSILISAAASASTMVLSNTSNASSGAAALSANSTMIMIPGPGGFPMPMMFSNGSVVANSFTTSNSPLPLESVTLLLGTSTGVGSFTVSLSSDNGGAPAATLALLTGNSMPSNAGEYSYSAEAGGLVLAANTTYWLRVELANPALNTSSTVAWSETTDLSESGPDGWTMGTKLTQPVTNGMAGGWSSDPTRAMMFTLNAVPEPASAALALLSGGLLFRRRRAMAV